MKHKNKMSKNNNHARTEAKKKVLKLKAFWKKVFEKRRNKLIDSHKTKGKPIIGKVEKYFNYMPNFGGISRVRQLRKKPQGQRKIRKLARQTQRKVA